MTDYLHHPYFAHIILAVCALAYIAGSAYFHYSLHKRRNELDAISQRVNEEIEKCRKMQEVKAPVFMWYGLMMQLEEQGDFETCAILRNHIEGKGPDEEVKAPEGFFMYDGIFGITCIHPSLVPEFKKEAQNP